MKKTLRYKIFIFIFFGLLTVFSAALFQANSPKDIYFFTDILILPAMYQDIIDGFPFSGWSFTPSPYFFPDLILYFPVRLLSGSFQASMYVYGMVQIFLLFSLSVFIVRSMFTKTVFLFSAASGYVLISVCIILISEFRPFAIILIPTVHFGAYLILLACILHWLRNFSAGSVIPVLTVCAGVSDRLFHVIFSIPFALSCIFLWRYDSSSETEKSKPSFIREFQAWKPAVRSVLLSVLISVLVYNGLKSLIKLEAVSRVSPDISWKLFVQSILSLYSKGGISAKILFAGFIPAYTFCFIYYIKKKEYLQRTVRFFLLFSLISVPVSLSAPVAAGTFLDEYSFRYSVFSFFLLYCSFFLVLYVQFRFYLRRTKRRVLETLARISAYQFIFFSILMEGILIFMLDWERKMRDNFSYVPDEVKCAESILGNKIAVYGLSDYWNAKYFTLFSENRLRVYQISYQDLRKNHTLNNKYWYEKGKSSRFGNPEYKFIITERLSEVLIEKKWGRPDSVHLCSGKNVWIYRKGISLD